MIHHSLTHTRTKLWASWRPFPPPVSSTPLMTSCREAAGSFQTPLCTVSSEISSVFLFFFYCTRKPLVQVMWWNYFLMPISCREWGSRNCPRALSWSMMGFLFREGGSWQQSLSGINNTHTYRSMCVSTYNTTHSLRRRINTSNIFLQWSNCELKYNKCLLYVCVCTTWQRQHYELVKQR